MTSTSWDIGPPLPWPPFSTISWTTFATVSGCAAISGETSLIPSAGSHPEDLLFLFFNSRYSRLSETVAHWFAEHGCGIILLTDREANPLSHVATLQLVAPSEGIGFFESRVAAFAVFETLSNLVAVEMKDQLEDRFEKFENAINAFEVFSEWWKHKSKRPARRKMKNTHREES